jgi:hypothetical protein
MHVNVSRGAPWRKELVSSKLKAFIIMVSPQLCVNCKKTLFKFINLLWPYNRIFPSKKDDKCILENKVNN